MSDEMTEFGWFRPGLESLAPGLHASGVVYGIWCNKLDNSWTKIGSVNYDRVAENLKRDIYNGQTKYLFVIEAAVHVSIEDTIHATLKQYAHTKYKDCFSVLPRDLLLRCIDIVKPINEKTMRMCAEPFLRDIREQHENELSHYTNRERVMLLQLETLMPLLQKAVFAAMKNDRNA